MQLRTQEQEKQESLNKLQEWEQEAAMLEQQARSEAQQKQEAVEKMEMSILYPTNCEWWRMRKIFSCVKFRLAERRQKSRLTSLTEGEDHLQTHVDHLGQEKMLLAVEKEETLHMLSGIQQNLCTLGQQKTESEEAENGLQHEVQQLKEELRCREVAEAGTSQQSLPEAPTMDKASVRLHNSTVQLQELFAEFQRFNDGCCKSSALVDLIEEWNGSWSPLNCPMYLKATSLPWTLERRPYATQTTLLKTFTCVPRCTGTNWKSFC
ncbi:uncharacterized protein ACB058_015840 [Synchiropus picturatus]